MKFGHTLNEGMSIHVLTCVIMKKISMHFNISLIEIFLFVNVEILFSLINDTHELLQRPLSES